jgi:hypothetical protein
MEMKFIRSHFRLQALEKPGSNGFPDSRHRLLPIDDITELPVTDRASFSLKVYALAFRIAMKEFTGSSQSIEAQALLQVCQDEIARGHDIR